MESIAQRLICKKSENEHTFSDFSAIYRNWLTVSSARGIKSKTGQVTYCQTLVQNHLNVRFDKRLSRTLPCLRLRGSEVIVDDDNGTDLWFN